MASLEQVGSLYFMHDRTQGDVNQVKELAAIGYHNMTAAQKTLWLSDLPGAFNLSDINRIELNIQTIATEINVTHNARQWNQADRPRASDFAQIRDDVARIRSNYITYDSTPTVPDAPLNTFSKINDIEQILRDIHELYLANTGTFSYTRSSGEIFTGEDIGDI